MAKVPNVALFIFPVQKCIVKALKLCINKSIIVFKNNDILNVN